MPPGVPVARPVPPVLPQAPAQPPPPTAPASPFQASANRVEIDVDLDVDPVEVAPSTETDRADEPDVPLALGDGPLVRARGPVTNRWSAVHYLILTFALLVVAAVVAFIVLYVPRGGRGLEGFFAEDGKQTYRGLVRNLKNEQENVFKLVVGDGQWTMLEKKVKDAFVKPVLGLKHAKDDAWFVVAVDDYGMQRPREAELMKVAVESLENYFGDSLELANKTQPSTVGGEEAVRLKFKGTVSAVVWSGEVHMLAHHGFGYWLYVAAPTWEEAERVKTELDGADGSYKGLVLHTDRRGWREQPPKMRAFRAGMARFTLTVPDGVWEETSAKDEEETGELFLFGRFKREKNNLKNAAFLIFSLDKKSDLQESLKAARDYVEKRKQEENAKYRLIPADDSTPAGEQTQVGDRPGVIQESKLTLGDEARRYYMLAVVHHGDKAFIARGDCVWEHRQIWRQDFLNALANWRFE